MITVYIHRFLAHLITWFLRIWNICKHVSPIFPFWVSLMCFICEISLCRLYSTCTCLLMWSIHKNGSAKPSATCVQVLSERPDLMFAPTNRKTILSHLYQQKWLLLKMCIFWIGIHWKRAHTYAEMLLKHVPFRPALSRMLLLCVCTSCVCFFWRALRPCGLQLWSYFSYWWVWASNRITLLYVL